MQGILFIAIKMNISPKTTKATLKKYAEPLLSPMLINVI
jgi:hypothetical protein